MTRNWWDSARDQNEGTGAEHEGTRDQRVLELVQEGCRLLRRSLIPGAQRKFQQALRLCETSIAARSHLALTYLLQGRFEQAAGEARAVLAADPDDLLALTTLARAQARRDVKTAREAARRAFRCLYGLGSGTRRKPDDLDRVASALAAVSDDRRLYELYRRSVRGVAGPWNPTTLTFLGVAAFNLGRYREARWLWRGALSEPSDLEDVLTAFLFAVDRVERKRVPPFRLDYRLRAEDVRIESDEPPGFVVAFALRTLWEGADAGSRESALDLLAQGKDPWASALLFQIVRDPDLSDELKMRAAVWLAERGALGEEEPLEMHLEGELQEIVIRKGGRPQFPPEAAEWFEQAVKSHEQGDEASAEDACRRVLELAPGFVPALVHLANICRNKDRYEEAEQLLSRARTEAPGDPVVLLHIGVLRTQQERFTEAEDILQEIEPSRLPPALRPSYYGLVGHVALRLNRPQDAAAAFRRGLAGEPGNEQLQAGLLAARLMSGGEPAAGETGGRRGRQARRRKAIDPGLSWETALARLTRDELAALSRRLGARVPKGLRKPDLVQQVAGLLRRRLKQVWQQLGPQEQAALRWMDEQGGTVPREALERQCGSEGLGQEGKAGDEDLVAARLQAWGLVFSGSLADGGAPVAVIPEEARVRLRKLWERR
ncbi:MAG: tetratricopeptide repeat protein [Firmicutes bacterium]|nr:tetratricopeptide repeat protein [Bacillota bacterium]